MAHAAVADAHEHLARPGRGDIDVVDDRERVGSRSRAGRRAWPVPRGADAVDRARGRVHLLEHDDRAPRARARSPPGPGFICLASMLAALGHRRHLTERTAHDPFELSGDRDLAGDVERTCRLRDSPRRAPGATGRCSWSARCSSPSTSRCACEARFIASRTRFASGASASCMRRTASRTTSWASTIPARAHLRVDEVLELGRKRDLHRVLLVGRGRDAAPMG